jgi:hypothetical protein
MLTLKTFAAASAAPRVCDFRLGFESDAQYGHSNKSSIYTTQPDRYRRLGLSVRNTTFVNAGDVGAGKPNKTTGSCEGQGPCCVVTVDDFLSMSDDVISKCWSRFMTSGGGSTLDGGTLTTNQVIIDIEACKGQVHPRHWYSQRVSNSQPPDPAAAC